MILADEPGRRATIALLIAQMLLFIIPYWHSGSLDRTVMRLFGY